MKFKSLLIFCILFPFLTLAQGSNSNVAVVQKLISAKDYNGAVAKASEILASRESTEIYRLRARAYRQLKNYKNEIADYQRLLEMEENADARLSLASAYLAIRDSSEANRLINHNLELHPDHIMSIVFSSTLASYKKDNDLALKILRDAYRKYDSPILLHARAIEYNRQGKYEEALSDYETLLSSRKSSSLYMAAANSASSAGNNKKSIEYYKKYLEINPNNSTALNNTGYHLQRIGKFTEAEIYLKKAIDVSPKNIYPLSGQAFLSYMQGDVDRAFSILDASLLSTSKSKVNALIRGHLNLYEGDLMAAEADYKQVLSDPSQNKYAYNALAKVYIYKGEYARAIDFLSDRIKNQRIPSPNAYNTRGFAYYKMGKTEEAIKDFLHAKNLEKDYQPIFNYLDNNGKTTHQNYTHVQYFTPFDDTNNSKHGYYTDGKKDLDFKIRIISKDAVDPSKISLYENGKLLTQKYWTLKGAEQRNFKFMDMVVTDVALQYTPNKNQNSLKVSYAGAETQTQTILK